MSHAHPTAVLITGAGGFIGSALVKSLAATGPAHLILLDSSEQNLFSIHSYLESAATPHEPILGSVTDAPLLQSIFARFRPAIVYHAAALKHVPLLELNPMAALRNNALGTYTLAQTAIAHATRDLILVSTDKAVNPRSIMGASKRLAELTVVALSSAHCRMHAVRLGNVKESTGSVIPIFRDQLARHVALTVTHPEASRYFMSLDQAVDAILHAAAGLAGKLLLPPLGEPRRIADLAQSLAGAAEIRFIGLRPGEKLTEDLISPAEVPEGLTGPLTIIATPAPPPASLHAHMTKIAGLLAARDLPGLIAEVRALVPEYQPSSAILTAIETGETVPA